MATIHHAVLAFFLHIVFISTSSQANLEHPFERIPFFIFGDSYLDAGNNNYIKTNALFRANYKPYGETYFKFPTGRFSDGRLIPDFVSENANLPLIPPFLQPGLEQYYQGVNFASAGAGALVETFQGFVIGLGTQLGYYKKVVNRLRNKLGSNEACRVSISKAVHLFSIGTNDYTSQFLTNATLLQSSSNSKYVEMVIGNLTAVIKEIYELGGRKFGFINLPPLGCVPSTRLLNPENNGKCFEEISLLATLHNKALSKLLYQLEKQLAGFKYSILDMNTFLEQRINHPANYGFKQGKWACCGTGKYRGEYSCGGKRPVKEYELCPNPSEYVFFDSFHLTERAYNHLASEFWSKDSPYVIGPYNLKQLFQAS